MNRDIFESTIQYSILDPTGNITALVETSVPVEQQPQVGSRIMDWHPLVEQVGFIQYPHISSPSGAAKPDPDPALCHVSLRMAGGEFCGNASMSAAAMYQIRFMENQMQEDCCSETSVILLSVSGAADLVEVSLTPESAESFSAGIHMPQALSVENIELTYEDISGVLPLVRMEGISHIIIEPSSPFFSLKNSPAEAGLAVRSWCERLRTDGLGLMFLEGSSSGKLIPLVYIPGSGTSFWENSCASGTSAAGMYLAQKSGKPVDISLQEPGGTLRVTSDPDTGVTWLYGHVRLREHFMEKVSSGYSVSSVKDEY